MDVLDSHHRLLKLKTIQKKSIAQKRKFLLLDIMKFEKDSVLIPYELFMIAKNEKNCSVQATAYAYFLKFLCHYHLHKVIQYEDSFKNLRLGITEYYFKEDLSINFTAYHLLRVAFRLIGDTKSPRRAFLEPLIDKRLSIENNRTIKQKLEI
ncbi:unnamed protein product [Mytilus coruscus]|uniref:Uncharacterized protein n=1 Tax=Mytilus coruscus TaxID=42192 RepID=A0A6J8EVU5_MYTCO|nr:unnamed protein product [Mytilus coruscus]